MEFVLSAEKCQMSMNIGFKSCRVCINEIKCSWKVSCDER